MTVTPKGRCHIIDGTLDYATIQGSITWSQKLPFMDSHGKTAEKMGSLLFCEIGEEDISCES